MITSFLMLAGMAAHGTSSVASSVETVQGRSTEEFYSTTSWASLAMEYNIPNTEALATASTVWRATRGRHLQLDFVSE